MEEERYQSFYEEENLCKWCEKRNIDRSENQESVLCGDCRRELIKLKIPPLIYGAMAAVLLLVGVAVYFFLPALKEYAVYENADRKAAEGHPMMVLNELLELNEKYPASKKIAIRSADIGMRYALYDYAGYAIETYLAGQSVSESEYDRLSGYQTHLEKYYNTLDLLDELGTAMMESVEKGEMNEEEVLAEFRNAIIGHTEDAEYDTALLCYYVGYYSVDSEERIYWLEQAIERNPLNYAAETDLANAYRRRGDLNKARELLDHAYSIDKDDALIQRAYAIMEMIDGSAEKALEYARTAYEWYPEGVYVVDTYIAALYAGGMPEEAGKLKAEWEARDYYFDAEMSALLAGEMTIHDYYIGE